MSIRRKGKGVVVALGAFGVLVAIVALAWYLIPREDDPGPVPGVPTLPVGYRVVHHHVWDGEVGLIDGRRVRLVAVEPPAGIDSGTASMVLCRALADGDRVERQTEHSTLADWQDCLVEHGTGVTWVGRHDRFSAGTAVSAADPCAPGGCTDRTLVLWME